MSRSRWIRPLVAGLCLTVGAVGSQAAFARGGGGFSHGGSHGGFSHGGGGFRGGYSGGGFSRGFGGYAPARHYYGGGYSPVWGVLGLGLFVASLPFYYRTTYWNGSPYYYADGSYYRYDNSVRQYERVTLPASATSQAAPASTELYAYPKNGQSDEQQSRDKAECRDWADHQDGAATAPAGAQSSLTLEESLRAQSACLEGRGYTVR